MKKRFNGDGSFDPRPGGNSPPIIEIPHRSEAVETTLRVIRTIVFTALFLFVCKLTHFRQKMLYDVRINRRFLDMFYFLAAVFVVIYLYLLITLRILRPPNKRVPVDNWDTIAPFPLYTCTICLVGCVISFIFALWPAFHFMTFIIGVLGFITMIFIFQWLPF